MSNNDLERWVTDELFWDPKVDNAAIAVSAEGGDVTLRGTVGSFRGKRESQNATERVYGVKSVANELNVRIMGEDARNDAELRGAVLQALMLDSLVPTSVDARVADGFVTLTGTAEWKYQCDEAEFVTGNVLGVLGVTDAIDLKTPEPKPDDVKESIKKALERNAKLDAGGLTVDTYNGTVAVTGTVNSWSEHDAAIAAAWSAAGVTDVDDRIVVDY